MRKIAILALVLSVLCAVLLTQGPLFAQESAGLREVMPEGLKLGMSYKKAKQILGEPLERTVRDHFYGVAKALFKTDNESYIILHLRLGHVKHIDLFEFLSYDAVLQRFNEPMLGRL